MPTVNAHTQYLSWISRSSVPQPSFCLLPHARVSACLTGLFLTKFHEAHAKLYAISQPATLILFSLRTAISAEALFLL